MEQEQNSKDHLNHVIDDMIAGKPEDAEINLHQFISAKARELVSSKDNQDDSTKE